MKIQSELDIFCENIRYLRRIHGLSQEEMAQCLKIDLYSLKQLETGSVPEDIEVTVLFAIQDSFSVPLSHIFRQLS